MRAFCRERSIDYWFCLRKSRRKRFRQDHSLFACLAKIKALNWPGVTIVVLCSTWMVGAAFSFGSVLVLRQTHRGANNPSDESPRELNTKTTELWRKGLSAMLAEAQSRTYKLRHPRCRLADVLRQPCLWRVAPRYRC